MLRLLGEMQLIVWGIGTQWISLRTVIPNGACFVVHVAKKHQLFRPEGEGADKKECLFVKKRNELFPQPVFCDAFS